jgi:hypothetical protein
VITTVSSAIDEPIGIGVGLAIKEVAAVIKFTQGQSLAQYVETVSEYHHRQERRARICSFLSISLMVFISGAFSIVIIDCSKVC